MENVSLASSFGRPPVEDFMAESMLVIKLLKPFFIDIKPGEEATQCLQSLQNHLLENKKNSPELISFKGLESLVELRAERLLFDDEAMDCEKTPVSGREA